MTDRPQTQDSRRLWLIDALLAERTEYAHIEIPEDAESQRRLLRALFNVRPPEPASDEFLAVQDAYLQERTREKGVTHLRELAYLQPQLYLWQGVTPRDRLALASCYRSCLELADAHGLSSLAFCCISTGEFHYPNDQAARVAIETVRQYLRETESTLEVVFNVFKPVDYQLYLDLLG